MQGKVRLERALINLGAQENYVQQALTIDYSQQVANKRNIGLAILNKKEVQIYRSYNINIKVTNSKDYIETYQYLFIVYDFNRININIILGYLQLVAINPTIGFRKGTQCYLCLERLIKILQPKEFIKHIQESQVFCLIAKIYKGQLTISTIIASNYIDPVPKEYYKYVDMFNILVVGILPKYYLIEYRINLEPRKELPQGLIYPLSKLELETL